MPYLDRSDWTFLIVITLIVLGIISVLFIDFHFRSEACEDAGGVISNPSTCRKGNEFYTIYRSNAWRWDYAINKYPKTER